MCESKGRSLRQEELDGYWRYAFVKDVISYLDEGHTAKFVVLGKSSGTHRLVEMHKRVDGEWDFSVTGKGSMYTYKYGDIIKVLEQLWDGSSQMIFFEGEIKPAFNKPICNPDAEPDTDVSQGDQNA